MTINWQPNISYDNLPLYLAITKALADDISSGKLPPDSQLPTHRELADKLKLAIGTVTRAYVEAEKRGLIRSEGRRGTFVGGSGKGRSDLAQMFISAAESIDFSRNHPNYNNDPDIAAALHKIARMGDVQKLLHYAPSAGYPHHREAAAGWLDDMGLKTSPDSIVITAGAQHALTVVFAAIAESNDIILTDSYTYPGLKATAGLYGLKLLGLPGDDEGILPESIESICQQKSVRAIYLNPTLQNPLNIVYSSKRRQQIAELADKFDFVIVEDELLRPLVDSPPPFISSYNPNRCFLIMSVSKTIAAGLRTGFVVCPVKYHQRVIDSLQTSLLSISPFGAELFTFWYKNGIADKIIIKRRQDIAKRQELVRSILGKYKTTTNPASPHVWLYLPENLSGNEFAVEAYRRKVAIAPAEIFAVNKDVPVNAIRIALATEPYLASVKKGLEIIAGILEGTPLQDSATV